MSWAHAFARITWNCASARPCGSRLVGSQSAGSSPSNGIVTLPPPNSPSPATRPVHNVTCSPLPDATVASTCDRTSRRTSWSVCRPGRDRDAAAERRADAERHRVERDRRVRIASGDVGGAVERELGEVDDAGPEQSGRLEDDDVGCDVGVHARDVELDLDPPVHPAHGRLERRRSQRRHRQLDLEVARLAGGEGARSGEHHRQPLELLADGVGLGVLRPVRVGRRVLVLPGLGADQARDDAPDLDRVAEGDADAARRDAARQEAVRVEVEPEVDPAVGSAGRDGHAADASALPSAPPTGRTMLRLDTIREAPKALLHDHLDGGLRPRRSSTWRPSSATTACRRPIPTTSRRWIRRGADRKSLELYLETFTHTVGVLQERDAIVRVAAECAEDLAADGVVYAEVRYAPELSTERGPDARRGHRGEPRGLPAWARERPPRPATRSSMKVLVTAMRQFARSVEVAECAVRWRDAGVVGFDVAGPEKGYPPTRYLEAFDYVRRENFHITIHAGESFGLPSIWEALQFCGAERLGHGVRIVDDIHVLDDGSVELGRLAAFVRDRRVPLEMCPTSNIHTGAVASIREHPIDLLRRLRFRVTLNTDNRLMSGVSMTSEFAALDEAFGIGLGEMEWMTINAMKSAFAPFDERLRLINEVVKPGYARLRTARVVGRHGLTGDSQHDRSTRAEHG